jgi:hypothetical protein
MKRFILSVIIIAIAAPLLAQLPSDYSRPEQNAPSAQSAPPQAPPAQTAPTPAAPPYTPKFHGDPARSDSEAGALAYMRVVMRAQVGFHKQYGHYANSLSQLVHSGTFTQRMVNPDRGDYTVGYKGKTTDYVLTMTPKAPDAQHRWFFADDDGKILADDAKPADASSEAVETHHF